MKKILHLITGLEVGGAENMLLKILPQTSKDFEHHVCSVIGVGPIGDKLAAAGIQVHYLDLSHSFDIGVGYRLFKILKKIKPEVMITYLPHADLLGRVIGKISRVPKIVCSIRVRLTRSKYIPYFIVDGLTSWMVDGYHFNSKTIANIHRQLLLVAKKKISVIPNAINAEEYDIHIDEEKKKSDLNVKKDKVIIGCVARLRKQKGHKYLLRAFKRVLEESDDMQLVLVGDGEEKENIVKEIRQLGIEEQVILLGNRHDVKEILQIFDIFAFTTLYEGMSNSIMEAMAAGRAIVTTDISENRELITNGKTGLLVTVNDIEKTAKALLSLAKDESKRKYLGRMAQKAVKKKYSIELVADKYRQYYSGL